MESSPGLRFAAAHIKPCRLVQISICEVWIMKRIICCLAICILCGCTTVWAANYFGITDPSVLNSNDFIDWGQLGVTYTSLSTPQIWVSNLGATGEVGVPWNTHDFERRDQGNGWWGNFTDGDRLIWTQGIGTLGILFDSTTWGGGANIQADIYGAFTATVTAYDINLTPVFSFSENGFSDSNGDGSAIFIGILSDAPDIYFMEFSVKDINGDSNLAINQYLFVGTPEPSTLLLLGSSFAGIAGMLRRKLL